MASCELIFLKRGARGRPRLQWLGRCCFLMVACPCMACVVTLPLAAAAPATAVAVAAPDSELDREPTWSPPTPAAVRQRMFDWIAASRSATEAATAARGLWPEAAAAREDAGQTGVDDLLDRVMTTFALLDPRCAALQADLAANRGWLGDAGTTDFQRESVKLWLGREFVRQDRFDDGLAVLADLDVPRPSIRRRCSSTARPASTGCSRPMPLSNHSIGCSRGRAGFRCGTNGSRG